LYLRHLHRGLQQVDSGPCQQGHFAHFVEDGTLCNGRLHFHNFRTFELMDFCDVTPCILEDNRHCSGGTHYLHL
jgi:hypothetical protein